MTGPAPVRVFVSWAHSSPGWTEERTNAWATTVATFASALRLHGIDADVDLFHLNDDSVDWTRFGPLAIDGADVTVVAVSAGWRERWEGTNEATVGAGAVQEADQLHGLFQRDQDEFQRRVKIALLPGASEADVPDDLRRLQRFTIVSFELASMEPLLRTLLRRPMYVAPPLGVTPELPARDLGAHSAPATSRQDERRLRDDLARLEGSLASLPEAGVDGLKALINQNRAVVAGALAAREAAGGERPEPRAETNAEAASRPVWRPMHAARAPMATHLDENRGRGEQPRLELHLVSRAQAPVLPLATLRTTADRLRDLLESHRPVDDALFTSISPPEWTVVSDLVDEVAVARAERRVPHDGASPEAVVELRVSRHGDVCAAAALAQDSMGALINDASLRTSLGRLLALAAPLVPEGVADTVPIVRLGPMLRIAPGDPAALGSRSSATMPWAFDAVKSTPGKDAVDRAALARHAAAVVEELVIQLSAALRRR